MRELTLFTLMTDDHYGWHRRIWCRAIDQLALPPDTRTVIVDNSIGGLDVPDADVVRDVSRFPKGTPNRIAFFGGLWQSALGVISDTDYVMALDWDVLPQATYQQMLAILQQNPRAGAVALRTRPSKSRCGWRPNYDMSAWRLKSRNPFDLEDSMFTPVGNMTLGRTNTCCVLFRYEALALYRPRRLDGGPAMRGAFESAIWCDLWENDWELWIAGELPWCRHYVDETHYIGEKPRVTEETQVG